MCDPNATQDIERRVNYRRGLFRGWIILSIIWSAAILIAALYEQNHHLVGLPSHSPEWRSYVAAYEEHMATLWTDWLVAIVAPWVLTGVVLGLRCNIKGFRSN